MVIKDIRFLRDIGCRLYHGEETLKHAGIPFATQSRWSLAEPSAALERTYSETGGEDWRGQVRWLNDFYSR